MKNDRSRCGSPVARATTVAAAWTALTLALAARADTPRIANVSVVPRDAQTAQVRFDLTWPNASRSGMRHDAVWVFFKARAEGRAEWRHPRLVADPPAPAGAASGGAVVNPKGFG